MCMRVFVHALWSERENWGGGGVGREEEGGGAAENTSSQ